MTDPGSLAFAYLVCIRSSVGLAAKLVILFLPSLFLKQHAFLVVPYLLGFFPSNPVLSHFLFNSSTISRALLNLAFQTRHGLNYLPSSPTRSIVSAHLLSHIASFSADLHQIEARSLDSTTTRQRKSSFFFSLSNRTHTEQSCLVLWKTRSLVYPQRVDDRC